MATVGDAQVTNDAPSIISAKNDGWDWFFDHYSMVEEDWRNRRQRYQDFYSLLVAKAPANPTPYAAKLRSRLVQQQVNTYQSFALSAILPSFPYVFAETVEPYRTNPYYAVESECTEEINARLKKAKFYSTMSAWIRAGAINGVGILKMVNGNMRIVDASNFAWDLSCNGDIRNDCAYVIERITDIDLETVKALWEQGTFNKLTGTKLKILGDQAPEPEDTGDYNADKEHRYRQRGYGTGSRQTGIGMWKRIEIHEVTTPSRRMWVNMDTSIVLGDIPNADGYINYYALQPLPENNEVQGWALPEILEDIQEEMNANLAQSIDNASLASNVMLKVRRNSGLDPFNLRVQPGKVFPVNDLDDVEFFQPNFNGRELYNQRGNLQLESDRVIGIMAQTRGEAGAASEKATVANIRNTNVNVRLNSGTNCMVDGPIRDVVNDFMRSAANDPNPVKLTKEEWDAVRAVINTGMMEMAPHPEAFVGNQLAKQQQLMNTFQMIVPLGILPPPSIGAWLQEILVLSGVRDPERLTRGLIQMIPQDAQAGMDVMGGGQMGGGQSGGEGNMMQTQALPQQLAAGQPALPPGIQG